MVEEPEEYVDFMVKYRDWIAIKKMGVYEGTRPEEVSFHLALIRSLIDKKAFLILGIKTDALDRFAANSTAGLRKNPASFAAIGQSFGSAAAKAAIEQACDNKELKPLAETYLLGKMITSIGYDTSLNQDAMSKIWKDLKIKKPPGRGPGKKAKAEQPAG